MRMNEQYCAVRLPRTLFVCVSLLGLVAADAAELTIGETVLEGEWTIVYPSYPREQRGLTQGLSELGAVLGDVLGEAVGLKTRVVVEGREPKGIGRRLFVGGRFAEAAGLLPADFRGWDWGIAEKDGDLYFFGRDRTGSNPEWRSGCVLPSCVAVSMFLRRQVGALFLMPGRIGREVPKLDRLAVPKGFARRGSVKAPYQSGRGCDYAYNVANAIYGAGAFHSYGGHTYISAAPRSKYRETHPEYFAKDRDGKPIWGGSEGCQAYCISNPDFRRLLYAEMLRRYDAGADVCQLGQNDGAAGLCKCKACHDLYGTGDDWCEKIWLFHCDIARKIQKDRPGKLVHMMCYADTANPPKTFKVFPENVLIEICRYGEEDMRKWDGYTVPHGFTYYIYNWSWYPILGFTPKRSIAGLVDQVKRFHRYGMQGIYRCGFGEMFGMEGPAYWVFNHLVEDPDTDVPAALATYYRGAFGPAAAPMRRFYEDLEEPLAAAEKRNSTKASDLVEATIKRPKERDPVGVLASVYTPARVARMDAALAEAQATTGLSERQIRRLQLVNLEWTYVRNVGTIAFDYAAFRAHPTKRGCDEILDLLDVRNAMIDRLFPNGKVRPVKAWPELSLFGSPPLEQFKLNGRLGAPIKVPLTWDVAKMRKYRIVPNELMTPEERRAELKAAGLEPIRTFAPVKADLANGATFRAYPDKTGFWLGQGKQPHVRATARIGAKEGLRPGKTYRISWLCRWEHVNSTRPWHGFYFSANFAPSKKDCRTSVQEPSDILHYGTSKGWTRESVVLKVCDEPNFASDFTFRYWGGSDGLAEVRDVAFEEVEP